MNIVRAYPKRSAAPESPNSLSFVASFVASFVDPPASLCEAMRAGSSLMLAPFSTKLPTKGGLPRVFRAYSWSFVVQYLFGQALVSLPRRSRIAP